MSERSEILILSSTFAVPGAVYRHKVKGTLYTVVMLAIDSETLEPRVIYKGEQGVPFDRPLSEFEDGRFEWMPRYGEDYQD